MKSFTRAPKPRLRSSKDGNKKQIFHWEPETFQISRTAMFREIRIVIKDHDTFSRDDVLLDCEIRYPFRPNNYNFSEDGDAGPRICVLNKDGQETDGEREGSENEDGGVLDTLTDLAGDYFKVRAAASVLKAVV